MCGVRRHCGCCHYLEDSGEDEGGDEEKSEEWAENDKDEDKKKEAGWDNEEPILDEGWMFVRLFFYYYLLRCN